MYPKYGEKLGELLMKSDAAMYTAKRQGINYYSSDIN